MTSHSADQLKPRISGDLITWIDYRNDPDERRMADVFAFDMSDPSLGVFPVATGQLHDQLLGVDGNLVATTRQYDSLFDRDGNPVNISENPYNLVVFNYLGDGVFSERYSTSLSPGSGHETRLTVDRNDGDFGSGTLVFEQFSWVWVDSASGGQWSRTEAPREVSVIDFANGDTSPRQALDSHAYAYSAAEHGFVFTEDYTDPNSRSSVQVFWWDDGTVRRITEPGTGRDDHGEEFLAAGNGIVVYDRDGSDDLFYQELISSGASEHLLTDELRSSSEARMDGNGIVWTGFDRTTSERHLYFSFIRHPDASVVGNEIAFSPDQSLEGQTIDVSAIVRNATLYDIEGEVRVALFDGDPNTGGAELAPPQVIPRIVSGGQITVEWSDVVAPLNTSADSETLHEIYVSVQVQGYDNPENNLASRALRIMEDDTGPAIDGLVVEEFQGDADGFIGSDERIRISWNVSDPSGVGSSELFVDLDGDSETPLEQIPLDGEHFVVIGPIRTGRYRFEIRAQDADDTPALTTHTGLLEVVGFDYGDLPDPTYPTLRSSDGARHVIGDLFLGHTVDADPDGLPSEFANGDDAVDDEDGIVFNGPLVVGLNASIDVTVTGTSGTLDAWIDFNRDGDLDDSGEKVVLDRSVLDPGTTTVTFAVPETATIGDSFARFRLSTNGSERPDGLAVNGEVEDYAVSIDTQTLVLSTNNLPAVPEGSSSSFTVKLRGQPTSNVVVNVARTSGDTDLSVSRTSLTFTTSNWQSPQDVPVNAAQDADTTNGSATFTVSATGLTSQTVIATEMDDDSSSEPLQSIDALDAAATAGGQVQIPVQYTVSDNDNTLGTFAFRLHYDSSKLQFDGLTDVFQDFLIQQQEDGDDSTSNFDDDPATDRFVLVAWADFVNSSFPDMSLPLTLYKANFTVSAGLNVGETSTIRFSESGTALTHAFDSAPLQVTVLPPVNLDVDNDGTVQVASDGFLILRYMFGFTGLPLTDGVLAPGAQRTDPTEIEEFLDGFNSGNSAQTASARPASPQAAPTSLPVTPAVQFTAVSAETSVNNLATTREPQLGNELLAPALHILSDGQHAPARLTRSKFSMAVIDEAADDPFHELSSDRSIDALFSDGLITVLDAV